MNNEQIKWLIEDRVEKYRQVIANPDEYYISYSGGKDSELISALHDIAFPNNKTRRVYFLIFGESSITQKYVKERCIKDPRFEIVRVPYTDLNKIGYPFKSKDFAESIYWYYRHNKTFSTVKAKRLVETERYGGRYACPKVLEYLLDDIPFKISRECCHVNKKVVGEKYARKHKVKVITGISSSEKGARSNAKCVTQSGFNPLANNTESEILEMIRFLNLELNPLYRPPFNQVRTGCVGCPYNIDLEDELLRLRSFCPQDYKKACAIFGKVYVEYERIGYRLSKDWKKKVFQISIYDFIETKE